MCRWVQTHDCCECYRGRGGVDTEVSGRRYTPPAQQFQCYVTKLRLYFYLYNGTSFADRLKQQSAPNTRGPFSQCCSKHRNSFVPHAPRQILRRWRIQSQQSPANACGGYGPSGSCERPTPNRLPEWRREVSWQRHRKHSVPTGQGRADAPPAPAEWIMWGIGDRGHALLKSLRGH